MSPSSDIARDALALAKTPQQREFVQFLLAIKDMTEDDLTDAIAACPVDVQARLADGPCRPRWTCGVCEAFGRSFYTGEPDADSPLWRAWGYHEVPKLEMRHANDRHYGPLANETYERAIATYRAAGWIGEAATANA